MQTYIEKRLPVIAAVWDGTKESMKSIIADLVLNHNESDYDEDGNLKRWCIGMGPDKKQVFKESYVVRDHSKVFVMDAESFDARYELVPSAPKKK